MKIRQIQAISTSLLCVFIAFSTNANTNTPSTITPGGSMSQAQELIPTNATPGEQFLLANKKKKGVVTLADGLQYKIIKQGHGPKPTGFDTVAVHYKGTLIDGSEFDSSYKRGEPATFPVSGVIPGWTEALKLMPVGSTWMLYIPSALAYGEAGAPPSIGPNETLIFEVKLLEIKK